MSNALRKLVHHARLSIPNYNSWLHTSLWHIAHFAPQGSQCNLCQLIYDLALERHIHRLQLINVNSGLITRRNPIHLHESKVVRVLIHSYDRGPEYPPQGSSPRGHSRPIFQGRSWDRLLRGIAEGHGNRVHCPLQTWLSGGQIHEFPDTWKPFAHLIMRGWVSEWPRREDRAYREAANAGLLTIGNWILGIIALLMSLCWLDLEITDKITFPNVRPRTLSFDLTIPATADITRDVLVRREAREAGLLSLVKAWMVVQPNIQEDKIKHQTHRQSHWYKHIDLAYRSYLKYLCLAGCWALLRHRNHRSKRKYQPSWPQRTRPTKPRPMLLQSGSSCRSAASSREWGNWSKIEDVSQRGIEEANHIAVSGIASWRAYQTWPWARSSMVFECPIYRSSVWTARLFMKFERKFASSAIDEISGVISVDLYVYV